MGYGSVGSRRNVFESPKAECFYAPRDCKVQIHSPWNVKIAVCATPVAEKTEPQVIHQDAVRVVRLGEKPWERDTSFIVDGSTNAKKLTIGECLHYAWQLGRLSATQTRCGQYAFGGNSGRNLLFSL